MIFSTWWNDEFLYQEKWASWTWIPVFIAFPRWKSINNNCRKKTDILDFIYQEKAGEGITNMYFL